MNYNTYSIKKIMTKISANEVYLPAIQRKFVWSYDQIELLFDSIMRNYPIGTFLFWCVKGENKDHYTFYKFIHEYHERDNYLNEVTSKPELKEKIIGVLDGQQRLSSLFIALQGTYAYKKKYHRIDSDGAFPKREMYLNLFENDDLDEGVIYEFKFLTEEESLIIDKNRLWFNIKEVLKWGKDPEIDKYYDDLIDDNNINTEIRGIIIDKRDIIKKNLRILHQRIVLEKLINFYIINEQDLDKILDIFVRVNSGGTPLSKSDLLFSTIVATWEKARDEIESLLEAINKKGDGFNFDNDFIMRSCLVLTDSPVTFTIKSFKKKNVMKIMDNWENIKSSIKSMVDLLVDFGLNGKNLTSLNATIPLAYYIMKGGKLDDKTKKELRIFLIQGLLQKVYGGQGDSVLASMREALRVKSNSNGYVLMDESFNINNLIRNLNLPGNKRFKIDNEDIDEYLEFKKGPYTFMILSLLYPNIKYDQIKLHQDHIHPDSAFTNHKLKSFHIPQDKWKKWRLMKDQLPNLQIMEGSLNKSKNKAPFEEWLNGKNSHGVANVSDKHKFLKDNYIPSGNLAFSEFEEFFEERKEILRKEIENKLFISKKKSLYDY